MNRRIFLTRASIGVGSLAVLPAISGFSCTPDQIKQAIADLPVAENTVDTILGIVATASGLGYITPGAVAIVNEIMKEVQVGLVAVGDYLTVYEKNPSASTLDNIDTALTAVSANLEKAMSVAGITDPVTLSVTLGLIAVIDSFVKMVQTLIPAAPTASTVRKTAQQNLAKKTVVPTRAQFESQVNALVVMSRPQYQHLQLK